MLNFFLTTLSLVLLGVLLYKQREHVCEHKCMVYREFYPESNGG